MEQGSSDQDVRAPGKYPFQSVSFIMIPSPHPRLLDDLKRIVRDNFRKFDPSLVVEIYTTQGGSFSVHVSWSEQC